MEKKIDKMRPATTFHTGVHRLTRWALNLGMGWVLVMMVVTTLDVAGRYFFSRPLPGTIEMSKFLLAVFGILGMAHTHQSGTNVRVNLFVRALPSRVAGALDFFIGLLGIQIPALLAWYGWIMGMEECRAGTTTDTLGIPVYPLYFLLAAGAFFLTMEMVLNLLDSAGSILNSGDGKACSTSGEAES